MFFISKASPLFFVLSIVWFVISLILKAFTETTNLNIFILSLYGFFLNVIIGAMYQLIPNSLNKKPRYPKFSFVVFSMSILNAIFMLLWYFGMLKSIYFAMSNIILIILFVLHIATAFKKPNSITSRFLFASLVFLVLNALEFLLWAFNKINIFFLIHTFTLGVVLNAVMGVELALVPLLYMEPINMSFANKVFWIHQISIIALDTSDIYNSLAFIFL